jgi:hypothetical protein
VLAGSTRLPAASSAAAKGHYSSTPGAVVPPPLHHHHNTTSIVGNSATSSSIDGNVLHHQQEVLDVIDHPMPEQYAAAGGDNDMDMFADMDGAINIATASNFNDPQKQQQQHATAADDDDHHLEQDDKQQLLDPFSLNFFDWVGTSFGIGDANNGGYT